MHIHENRNKLYDGTYKHNIKKADDAKTEHDKATNLQGLIYAGEK